MSYQPYKRGASFVSYPAQPVIGQHWFSTLAGPGFAETDLRMPRG